MKEGSFGDALLPAALPAVQEMPGGEIRHLPLALNALEPIRPTYLRQVTKTHLLGLEHHVELTAVGWIGRCGHHSGLTPLIHLGQMDTQVALLSNFLILRGFQLLGLLSVFCA